MRLKWRHKLRSGALQFTIFISVIIALLLAGVLILFSTHRFFLEQSKTAIDNIRLADSGIEYLCNQQILNTDTIALEIPQSNNAQSIRTHLSQWGVYEKAYVEATHRKKKFIKTALIGSSFLIENRNSLYLQETFKPLMVVGTTRIEGKISLPEQSVRTGNISGHSYYNDQLIYGTVERSAVKLPEHRHNYTDIVSYYLKEYKPINEKEYATLEPGSKIINTFTNPAKGYISSSMITLEDITLTGNIIIQSQEKIIVKNSAILKDIILAAPVIEIEDNFQGSLQAFANETIKIGKKCSLVYPSSLVLAEKATQNPHAAFNALQNKIHIDIETKIKGSICYLQSKPEPGFLTNIHIGLKSDVAGEIYCEGNLELRGDVTGSVYTNQFITNEGGTVFINHLYNVSITNGLPENFGGILFENEKKSVVKWLY